MGAWQKIKAALGMGPKPPPTPPKPAANAPPPVLTLPLPGTPTLTARDLERLKGVHPDLVRVVARARRETPFMVIEGVRTMARQRELLAKGASKILDSRHLTGHAVDLGPLPLDWNDWPAFRAMADAVLRAAKAEGVPITWGGSWPTFRDGPHFELPRGDYPG